MPKLRSNSSITAPAVSTGRPASWIVWAARAVQQKIGIRNQPMPGARIRMIVVQKFTAPRIELTPEIATARIQRNWPFTKSPSGFWVLSGG